jgi:hypothetical protein
VVSKQHDDSRLATLHIGMPKTATKTMQMCVFARHSEIDYLGTYTRRRDKPRQCRDHDIEQLMAELIWDRYESPDLSLSREIYDRAVRPALLQGNVPVWSWESLIENNPHILRQRAENLHEVFGDCRIIVAIRHPVKLVESLYLQMLKRDHIGGRAKVGKRVNYQPIDRWISKRWGVEGHAPNAHLNYAKSIQIYADVFGADRVGVFPFEQLIEDPVAYYRAVCEFMKINSEEAIQHAEGERENQRWTAAQIERLQTTSQSWVESLRFRFSNRSQRRKLLGVLRDGSTPETDRSGPARAPLSEEWIQRIQDRTRTGNRQLARNWSLPLEKYDYPL